MANYAEMNVEGETIFVEIDSNSYMSETDASVGQVAEKLSKAFDEGMNIIRLCGEKVVNTIQNLTSKPDEASIEFGIKIDTELGAVIARTITSGHFTVTLTWKNETGHNTNEPKS